jgi:hypothetical protein
MIDVPIHALRRWRLSQGLTLDAAAAGVGTFRGTWNDWETGRRIPDRNYMPKVWAFTKFAVEPNDFYIRPDPHQRALPLDQDPMLGFEEAALAALEPPALQAAG